MREKIDRFFNEPVADLRGWTEAAGLPPVDLFQTNDEVVVMATLPGVPGAGHQHLCSGRRAHLVWIDERRSRNPGGHVLRGC